MVELKFKYSITQGEGYNEMPWNGMIQDISDFLRDCLYDQSYLTLP